MKELMEMIGFENKMYNATESYHATKRDKVLYEIRKNRNTDKERKQYNVFVNDICILKNKDKSTCYEFLRTEYNVIMI